MKKIEIRVAVNGENGSISEELSTAYLLPLWEGLQFVALPKIRHGKKWWSISEYKSGRAVGPLYNTRKKSVETFLARLDKLCASSSTDRVVQSIKDSIDNCHQLNK